MNSIESAGPSAYTFSWGESLDEGVYYGPSGKRHGVTNSSSGLVWQLCAASLGMETIADPRKAKELLEDAMWLGKDARIGWKYSESRIEEAKQFCERLELAASNLTSGNIFGLVDVESFTALADAADWKLPPCFTRGENPPLVHMAEGDGGYDLARVDMEIRAEIERRRTEIADKDAQIRNLKWEVESLSKKNRRLENRLLDLEKKHQRVKKVSKGRLLRLKALSVAPDDAQEETTNDPHP